MKMKRKTNVLYGLLLIAVLLPGCSTISSTNKSIKELLRKEPPKTPSRMVSFWQCYAQTNPGGGNALRGVGGRIIFYGAKNIKDPIKVNGELTIYLFDASDPIPEKSVPLKFAIFKKDAIPSFYRKDEMGIHGYDFFVPLDEIDNEEKEVQVLAIYKEEKKPGEISTLINSMPAVVTLLGNRKKESESVESEEPKREIINESAGPGPREISLADGRNTDGEILQASYYNAGPKYGEQKTYTAPEYQRRKFETITLPGYYTQAYQQEQWTLPQNDHSATGNNTAAEGYYNGYGYYGSGYQQYDNSRYPDSQYPDDANTVYETGTVTPSDSNRFNRTPQYTMPPQFRTEMPSRFRTEMPPQFHQTTPASSNSTKKTTMSQLRKEYETVSDSGVSTQVFLGPPASGSRR